MKEYKYTGKRKLMNPDSYEESRAVVATDKSGMTDIAFNELDGIIDKSQMAIQYFEKTPTWFSQKLNGCMVLNNQEAFTEDEYDTLTTAFRDIAKRLTTLADEIDAASMDD